MMRRWRRFATLWWVYAMGCAAHLITTALAAATVRTIALGQSFSPWLPNWTALLLFGALCITVGAVPAIVQSEAERRWRARHGIEDARVHSARRTAVMTILVLLPFTAVCAIIGNWPNYLGWGQHVILLAPWAAYAAAPWPMTRLMLLRSVRAAARGRSAQEMAGGVERCPECGKEIASQWARLAPVSLWWRWLAPCVAGMAVVLFAACDWRWEQWSYPDDPSKLTGTTGKTYADVLAEADDDPASVGAAIAGGFPTSTMRPTDDAALVFQFQPASQLVSSEIAVGWPMPAVRRSVLTRFSRAIPPEQLPMKDSIDGVFDGKVTMWSGTAMSFHPSGGDPMENVSYTVDFGGAAITIVVAVLAGVLVRVGFAAHRGLTAFRRRWSGLCVGCGYRLWSPVELFPPVIATTAGGADAE